MLHTKKLSLSKETLRTLDDSELTDVVGGQPSGVCVGFSVACDVDVDVDSVICQSGVCRSVVCNSAVCNSVAICDL